MSTFKQSLRESPGDPWSFFSWNNNTRFNSSVVWTDNFIPLDDTHIAPEIANAKNSIETCGPQYLWNFAKKIINPYELVYTYKKDNIPKSLSMHIPLSRSYFKMIEILQLTEYFKRRPSKMSLTTAHVCEGPGGFIEAIYEIASRNSIKIKNTHAITLRSTQPHIPGWRRAQQFLQRHRQVKIEYGPDGTGDILKKENRDDFIRKTGKVNIYTADGGFDFTADYLAQEKNVFPLIVASVHIGFSVLENHGFFVLKIFDQFEQATQQLIAFMASHFDQWTIYKPATSRPCNSEQYFIGYGFRGCKKTDLDQLERLIDFNDIPLIIFDEIELNHEYNKLQQEFAMNTQIDFLTKAQMLVAKWHKSPPTSDELQHLWNTILITSLKFCKLFKIYHYNVTEAKCDLRLPKISEDEESIGHGDYSVVVGDLDEIVEAKSSLPDEYQQSLKPDVVSESRDPSVPTSESFHSTDSCPLPPKSF
jgi:23S rRNA U2552 (ribose-2'-O)-methylase RlmE/FtsJ